MTRDMNEKAEWDTDEHRLRLLSRRPTTPRMVLDTDTYNEIDDQFALAHVLLAPDVVRLEAIYAAPFHNDRSSGPADGMRKSYEEILRVLDRVDGARPPVFYGATGWLDDSAEPSPGAVDLIQRARASSDEPLYVVAIGAITNIAAAIVAAPDICANIVVVWLGGHAGNWGGEVEFNLRGDISAARVVFDSGVPLLVLPCLGVADHLVTTRAEIDQYVRPCGELGSFLAERYAEYIGDTVARSKVLWDIGATGWMLNPSWLRTRLIPSPMLGADGAQAVDPARHLIAQAYWVDRDAIYGDLFTRLAAH